MERNHAPRPAGELLNAVGHLSLKQLEVFHVIQENPDGIQVAEIGKALGMHPNTVRGHLEELLSAGVVSRRVAPGTGRGRPSHIYTARVARTNLASHSMIALVEVLASTLADQDTDSAKRLGRQWAERVNTRRHDNLRVDLDTAERTHARPCARWALTRRRAQTPPPPRCARWGSTPAPSSPKWAPAPPQWCARCTRASWIRAPAT